MRDLECPYCGEGQDVCHDDGFGYSEDMKHEMQCESCGKNFVFTTSIMFYYDPEQADCLNGSEHKYERTRTFPEEFSRMECSDCGDIRDMTDDERKEYGIGTVEDYYKKLDEERIA